MNPHKEATIQLPSPTEADHSTTGGFGEQIPRHVYILCSSEMNKMSQILRDEHAGETRFCHLQGAVMQM